MKNETTNLLNYTRQQLSSFFFKLTHKTSPQHFTRDSLLNFFNTAFLIVKMIKKSTKAELMDYFYDIDKNLEIPSRQAFSQAREKISYSAFKDFFEKSCELAIKSDSARTYKGYRLFAVDGTSFVAGTMDKLSEYFGHSTTIPGKAMCRISAVVDVLNKCIVNAVVSPFSVGERALAIGQVGELKSVSNALYLFDRGYWSPELASDIISSNQKFIMRLASNTGKTLVTDENGNTVKLRRYSFVLPNGETENLLTNITEDIMSNEEIAFLYTKRWGVETKYLELKARLQIANFSGESVNIVLQDIYATMYISNLTAFICFDTDEIINEKTADKNNKYEQQTNRAVCITTLRKRFVDICVSNPLMSGFALRKLYIDIQKEVTYINKSKSRPRSKHKLKDASNKSYKSVL
jgi:hypothetical protein